MPPIGHPNSRAFAVLVDELDGRRRSHAKRILVPVSSRPPNGLVLTLQAPNKIDAAAARPRAAVDRGPRGFSSGHRPRHMPLVFMVERHVKLFKNGRNQAVRIPREFELPGEDAIIRKEGERLIIEPAPQKSLLAILATLPTLDEEFPPIEDLRAEPVDL